MVIWRREGTMIVALEDTGSAVDLERLSDRLEDVEGVTRAFGYTSLVDPRIPVEFVPAEARESFFSGGYTYLTLDVSYDMADPRLAETIDASGPLPMKSGPARRMSRVSRS